MKRECKRMAEHDVVYNRRYYCWTQRAGATAAWKKIMRRRERHQGNRQARREQW